jgi:cytochrome c biogenesis protein CcmG/thiol:disulfide interchange protein DsbE
LSAPATKAAPDDVKRRGGAAAWIAIVAGIGVVVVGIVFADRFGSDPTLTASPLIGQPVPAVTVAGFDGGEPIDLTALEGDITVVNFWASWCLGCRQEHEALLAAADTYSEFGVTFVGVNYQDSPGNAVAFLDELGRGDGYLYGSDEESRTAFEFGVLGLPETFFIDRDGIIVGKVSGPVSHALLVGTLDRLILGEAIDAEVTTGEVENR